MKFSMLSQPAGSLKLLLHLFCISTTQGRELCWRDFMTYTFGIVVCQDTCEPICFKLGVMLNTTEVCSLILVWIIVSFSQSHWVMGKLELEQSFCCKVEWSNSNVQNDYVRKATVKKSCKYGKYGSFELLLFLFKEYEKGNIHFNTLHKPTVYNTSIFPYSYNA